MAELKTHELVAKIADGIGGRKEMAYRFHLSPEQIAKWCEPKEGSGSRNPFDRCREFARMLVEIESPDLIREYVRQVTEIFEKSQGSRMVLLADEHLKALREIMA